MNIQTCSLFIRSILFCAASAVMAFSSCEQDISKSPAPVPSSSLESQLKLNFTLAKTNAELAKLHADKNANLVRTPAQFDAILAAGQTPLARLPKAVQQEFRSHLVFREGIGVVGLNFACIESELSYDEFAQVLALFGLDVKQGYWGFSKNPKIMQQLAAGGSGNEASIIDEPVVEEPGTDYKGYHCNGKHTCLKYSPDICLSGC